MRTWGLITSAHKSSDETGSRGMNIVALEPRTHNVLIKRAYDTSTQKSESRRLARDLESLASG